MKALIEVYILLFFIGFASHHLRQILLFLHLVGLMLSYFVSCFGFQTQPLSHVMHFHYFGEI